MSGVTGGSGGRLNSSLVWKMSASSESALVWVEPKVGNGDVGDGVRIVWIKSRTACIAYSQLDCCGIGATCGKNSLVSDVL